MPLPSAILADLLDGLGSTFPKRNSPVVGIYCMQKFVGRRFVFRCFSAAIGTASSRETSKKASLMIQALAWRFRARSFEEGDVCKLGDKWNKQSKGARESTHHVASSLAMFPLEEVISV